MKKLFAILLLVTALLAASPLFFSYQAREAYQSLSEQIVKDGFMIVQDKHYRAGYLHSSADASIAFDLDAIYPRPDKLLSVTPEPLSLKVTHEIKHGPFPNIMQADFRPAQALIITRLNLSEESRDGLLAGNHPIILSSWMEFSGDSMTEIKAAPFTVANKNGNFSWRGLDGYLQYSAKN